MSKQVIIEVNKPFTEELFMELLVQALKICVGHEDVEGKGCDSQG